MAFHPKESDSRRGPEKDGKKPDKVPRRASAEATKDEKSKKNAGDFDDFVRSTMPESRAFRDKGARSAAATKSLKPVGQATITFEEYAASEKMAQSSLFQDKPRRASAAQSRSAVPDSNAFRDKPALARPSAAKKSLKPKEQANITFEEFAESEKMAQSSLFQDKPRRASAAQSRSAVPDSNAFRDKPALARPSATKKSLKPKEQANITSEEFAASEKKQSSHKKEPFHIEPVMRPAKAMQKAEPQQQQQRAQAHRPSQEARPVSDMAKIKTRYTSAQDIAMAEKQLRIKTLQGDERATQEQWAKEKLAAHGVCPAGYNWRPYDRGLDMRDRLLEGYRCDGGNHMITHELIAEGSGDFYHYRADDIPDWWPDAVRLQRMEMLQHYGLHPGRVYKPPPAGYEYWMGPMNSSWY